MFSTMPAEHRLAIPVPLPPTSAVPGTTLPCWATALYFSPGDIATLIMSTTTIIMVHHKPGRFISIKGNKIIHHCQAGREPAMIPMLSRPILDSSTAQAATALQPTSSAPLIRLMVAEAHTLQLWEPISPAVKRSAIHRRVHQLPLRAPAPAQDLLQQLPLPIRLLRR